jgi:hypothetical protein
MPAVRTIVGPLEVKRIVGTAQPPLLSYNGGPLLANVEVTTIYWGSAWNNDPLMAQLEAFFDFIVTSSLIDQLAEYSVPGFTIGPGKHVACAMAASEPGATVDDSTIQAELQGWIASGLVPSPDANSLYFVFTPPGTTVTMQGASSCQQFCGYHSTVNGDSGPFYAVMPYLTCAACAFGSDLLSSNTIVASHELCEGITDPGAGTGWVDNNTGNEIGDICEGSNKTITMAAPLEQAAVAAPSFTVSVSPSTVAIDGTAAVNLNVTLTPSTVAPPPPATPPPPRASYLVQAEWSNVQGACV